MVVEGYGWYRLYDLLSSLLLVSSTLVVAVARAAGIALRRYAVGGLWGVVVVSSFCCYIPCKGAQYLKTKIMLYLIVLHKEPLTSR